MATAGRPVRGHEDVEAAHERQVRVGAAAGEQPHVAAGQVPAARLGAAAPPPGRRRRRRAGSAATASTSAGGPLRTTGRPARATSRAAGRPEAVDRHGQLARGDQPGRAHLRDQGRELRGGVVPTAGHRLERDQPTLRHELGGDAHRVLGTRAGDEAAQRARDGAEANGHVETVVGPCVPRPGAG